MEASPLLDGVNDPAASKWSLRYHFGTDMLIASWLFLLSSLLWVVVESLAISTNTSHRFATTFSDWNTLTAAVLFLLGSIWFVRLSYPSEMVKMMKKMEILAAKDAAGELSWMEKYVTGTDFLLVTWSFAFAFVPFLINGLYDIFTEPGEAYGYIYTLVMFFFIGFMLVWVYACKKRCIPRSSKYYHITSR